MHRRGVTNAGWGERPGRRMGGAPKVVGSVRCNERAESRDVVLAPADTVPVREPYDVLAGLARSYLFEDLTAEALEPLVAVVTTRRLVRGETLFSVGDAADEIFVVLSGEVKDSVVDAAGVETVHFLHGPGMTVGEPGFFAIDRHRVVEVIAIAPSVVVRLARRETSRSWPGTP